MADRICVRPVPSLPGRPAHRPPEFGRACRDQATTEHAVPVGPRGLHPRARPFWQTRPRQRRLVERRRLHPTPLLKLPPSTRRSWHRSDAPLRLSALTRYGYYALRFFTSGNRSRRRPPPDLASCSAATICSSLTLLLRMSPPMCSGGGVTFQADSLSGSRSARDASARIRRNAARGQFAGRGRLEIDPFRDTRRADERKKFRRRCSQWSLEHSDGMQDTSRCLRIHPEVSAHMCPGCRLHSVRTRRL